MRKTRKNWLDRLFTHLSNLLFLLTVTGLIVVIGWTSHIAYDAIWGPDHPIVIASTVVHPRPKTHQVISGDTLWTIAVEYYPNVDPRDVVGELRKINSLASATIYPNQILILPEVE